MFQSFKNASVSLLCTLLMAAPAFAAEGEAHASSGGLPQFDPTSWPSQLFWLTVFFVVLYLTFGKSIIPTLGKTIESRVSYIADHLKKAEALSAEAEIIRNEVNAVMKTAGQQANAHIVEAENTSKDRLSTALTQFRERFEDQVSVTEQKIADAKQAAMNDMEQIVVSLAAQAAEKIAGIPASESGAEGVVKSLGRKVA